jgi:preprotein translocase subunit SecF
MELFRNTNFDFLGKKWPFIIASLVLSALGIGSLIVKGGPRYGIEFRGGLLMTAKFQGAPPLNEIRSVLDKALPSPPSVQTFENQSNEVEIGTEGSDEAALAKNREIVLATLAKTFGHPDNGKLDLNNAASGQLADRLRDPLLKAGVSMSDPQINQLAADIISYRNKNARGLLTNVDEVKAVPGVTPQILNVLKDQTYLAPYDATAAGDGEIVGPKVGADLTSSAIQAVLLAMGGMLLYIWFRFEWIYGAAAVIAAFHDTIITIGIFSLFNKEISLTVVAALLTLVGYSMNDTIVIFDRIRENLNLNRREKLVDVINRSVNQTLSRTVMTSGLTFLAVISLFLFGGPVLHGFSFALVAGIIVGTYSSVYVASPIVLGFHDWVDARRKSSGPDISAPVPVAAGPVKSVSKPAAKPAAKPGGKSPVKVAK